MRVCLGGTFDRLHVGHEALLRKAFEVGDEVFIGLTSQRLAQARRGRRVRPYARRLRALHSLLRRKGWTATVAEIDHPYGRSTEARYDAIVVSPETLPRVKGINAARRRRRLPPIKVFTIPYFYSGDGLRITATRIAQGDIDGRGRRLTPLRVAVGSRNPTKVLGARDAFRRAFPRLRVSVRGVHVSSGVAEQPKGKATYRGALNRARGALAGWRRAEYGVGVEAGILRDPHMRRWKDVQYVAILDRQGSATSGHGGGFYYPDPVTKDVLSNRTVSSILGEVAGDPRVGSTIGAVGFLTRGALHRRELTEGGVLAALVPRVRRELYQE